MNRPLALTQRQVRAICEGAKKAGCVPVVSIGNAVIQLIPEDRIAIHKIEEPVDREEEIDL